MNGIKSQNIVVLLKLVSLQEQEEQQGLGDLGWSLHGEASYSVRGLEALLGISKTEINGGIKRSLSTGLVIKDRASGRPSPNRRNLYSFIVHGLKYVFPAMPGGVTRGIPTAFAAPMLKTFGRRGCCRCPPFDLRGSHWSNRPKRYLVVAVLPFFVRYGLRFCLVMIGIVAGRRFATALAAQSGAVRPPMRRLRRADSQ